jgi:predicted amidophosphoribosyltransferase
MATTKQEAHLCTACGRSCRPEAVVCTRCSRRLGAAEPLLADGPAGLDRIWSLAPCEGVARNLVTALRFRHVLPVASFMAGRIEWLAPSNMLSGTVVPVPVRRRHPRAKRFDPSLEIARALSTRVDLPLDPCLEYGPAPSVRGRHGATPSTCLAPIIRATCAAPRRALLIGDVLGSGATLTACARTLRAAGASRVVAITFARRP